MSSPSEFLTFYRRAASPAVLRQIAGSQTPAATRSFVSSVQRCNAKEEGGHVFSTKGTHQDTSTKSGNDTGLGREHALDKGPKKDPNVQSYESNAGREARASDTGGQATRQTDERGTKQKAKEEFPEAPDTIGMQDERGGKGF